MCLVEVRSPPRLPRRVCRLGHSVSLPFIFSDSFWCPEGESNPHDRLRSADFKSVFRLLHQTALACTETHIYSIITMIQHSHKRTELHGAAQNSRIKYHQKYHKLSGEFSFRRTYMANVKVATCLEPKITDSVRGNPRKSRRLPPGSKMLSANRVNCRRTSAWKRDQGIMSLVPSL